MADMGDVMASYNVPPASRPPRFASLDAAQRWADDTHDRLVRIETALRAALAAPAMGSLRYAVQSSETTISAASTFYRVVNDTTLHDASGFSMPVPNRLRYDDPDPIRAIVLATLSLVSRDDNQVLELGVALNGSVQTGTVSRIKTLLGADTVSVTVLARLDMVRGDHLELWVANNTSAGNVTVVRGHLTALGSLGG